MVAEAQYIGVSLVSLTEIEIISQNRLTAFRACELCGYLLYGLRENAVHIGKAWKHILITIAEVVLKIPELSCDQLVLVVLGPGDFVLCGKLPGVQQLAYALCGVRPWYEL